MCDHHPWLVTPMLGNCRLNYHVLWWANEKAMTSLSIFHTKCQAHEQLVGVWVHTILIHKSVVDASWTYNFQPSATIHLDDCLESYATVPNGRSIETPQYIADHGLHCRKLACKNEIWRIFTGWLIDIRYWIFKGIQDTLCIYIYVHI